MSGKWDKVKDAWKVEAADINIDYISDDEFKRYFVIKDEVNDFLTSTYKNIIMAPKGYGKTLFLRRKALKYKKYEHQDVTFPPGNVLTENGSYIAIPLLDRKLLRKDYVIRSSDFAKNENIVITDDETTTQAVNNSIIPLSEVNAFKKNYLIDPNDLNSDKGILQTKIQNLQLAWEYAFASAADKYLNQKDTVKGMGNTGNNLTLSIFNNALLQEPKTLGSTLEKMVSRIDKECYIFIDDIDLMVRFGYYTDHLILPFWIALQLAFCLAVLAQSHKHIHVYGAIRHEALNLLDSKYLSFCDKAKLYRLITKLRYTKDDIKKIYENNISLAISTTEYSDAKGDAAVMKYFGLDNKIPNNILGLEENLFDYFYRHSFWKPRDILQYGDKTKHVLNNHDNQEKRKDFVKDLTHDKDIYKTIVDDYLIEIGSIVDKYINDLSRYEQPIPNILTKKELQSICGWLNRNAILKNDFQCGQCIICEKDHFFCYLYLSGLLGTPVVKGKEVIQRFQRPDERIDIMQCDKNSIGILLNDNYFFIHPLLSAKENFKVNNKVLVGNELPFYSPVKERYVKGNTSCLFTCTLESDWAIKAVIQEDQRILLDRTFQDVASFKADEDIISIIDSPVKMLQISQEVEILNLNSFTNLGVL